MKKKSLITLSFIVIITVLVNMLAWQSSAFCDFYVKYIFPIWINTYGRVTGLCHFSVGEWMIVAGLILIALAIVFVFVTVIFRILFKKSCYLPKVKRCSRYLNQSILWIAVFVFTIMTLNCFLLYHCSTFEKKYLNVEKEDYTLQELINLRDYVVMQANTLSEQVERDESGRIIYDKDMGKEAIKCMQSLGEEYDQLSGYYPEPKPITSSEFLSQQHMKGYYFPFSMEANYNNVMDTMNKPATMCHELAHLKGFIYEDEANLIGFLACINSDDVVFQYSGYLSILNYIDHDFYESVHKNKAVYKSHVAIKPRVKKDNVFLTEESWAKVEKKAIVKTATVKKAANRFVDANLVLNGIEDGSLSYTRVVGLMLDYYECNCDVYENQMYMVQGIEKK